MSLPDFPMPPEAALDAPPLTDADLDAYFSTEEEMAAYSPEMRAAQLEARDLVVPRWRVEDDAGAEWALRKLAVAQEDTRRLAEQAQDWQARIGAWFAQASRTPARTAALMEEKLADYALRLREAGGPATLNLPSGVIKTSERKPAVEVEDDAMLARYLDEVLLPDSEVPAWLAAWSKAVEGMEEPLEVVKRTPKVYVGPLRKLGVRPVERPTGQTRITLSLACDHEVSEVVAGPVDPEDAAVVLGSSTACDLCPVDTLDGEAMQAIVAIQVEELTELVAVGPDGEPVPGASVRPGGIVPKVEAR